MHKKTKEQFIEDAEKVHGDKYNYDLVVYIKNDVRVKIRCLNPEHDIFLQLPSDHLGTKNKAGSGCLKCAMLNKPQCQPETKEQFIDKARKVHGNKYNYDLVVYKNNKKKVIINCQQPGHGSFLQTPTNHLGTNTKKKSGKGCPKCAGTILKTKEQFIEDARKVHGDTYNYDLVNYIDNRRKVEIICSRHGSFFQSPNNHVNQSNNCPDCSHRISKPEQQWLAYLSIPNTIQYRQILININDKKFKVDGFDPASNTIYEFYGDYWHGNPAKYKPQNINKINNTSFAQLYQNTLARENLLKSAGYNLITIWESDWKTIVKQIKILVNFLSIVSLI